MWVIWPNIAVYSLIVYGGVQLLFVGFFGAQFLLAVLEPNRKKVVTLWRTLFHVHSRAYWLAVAAFVVFALAWVSDEY